MRSYYDAARTRRKKPKLPSVMFGSLLFLVATSVTIEAQESRYFTSPEFSRPEREWSIHEMAQRYGVTDAVEYSFQREEQEEARREMERLLRAQQRDRELREKVAELARTSIKLYQRFGNPSETHADTSQLAKKCEELAKDIKKLLR